MDNKPTKPLLFYIKRKNFTDESTKEFVDLELRSIEVTPETVWKEVARIESEWFEMIVSEDAFQGMVSERGTKLPLILKDRFESVGCPWVGGGVYSQIEHLIDLGLL